MLSDQIGRNMPDLSGYNLKTRKRLNTSVIFVSLLVVLAIIGAMAFTIGLTTGLIHSVITPNPDFLCKEMGWTYGERVKSEIYCHRTVWGTEYTQNYRVLVHCDRDDWQCQTEVYLEAR